jgi:general secretion pathway protein K
MAMPPMLRRPANDRGFALVLVLWIAGLLAVLTAGLSGSARTQLRVAANVAEAAKAEALADGGVALAVMDLIAARRSRDHQRRFPIDGAPLACGIPGEGTLAISIADEAGRIDINSGGLPLLRALFAGLGQTPEQAARHAEAIFDFRDPDDERRPNGAEANEYREAGLGWLPKNGPLQSLAELEQVHGLTPELIERIRPYLSTHSGLPGLDVTIARPELIGLLRSGREGAGDAFASVPELDANVTLPAMFVSTSERVTFALRVTARTSAGAVFVREAILDLGRRQQSRHIFRGWTRGLTGPTAQERSTLSRQTFSC